MNLINYANERALLLTSDDLFNIDSRLDPYKTKSEMELKIKELLENKAIRYIIIVTSLKKESIPLWLRSYLNLPDFNGYRGIIYE